MLYGAKISHKVLMQRSYNTIVDIPVSVYSSLSFRNLRILLFKNRSDGEARFGAKNSLE